MQGKLEDLLFELEERFWSGGAEHYARYLADAAVMVFPAPAGVLMKDEIVRSVAGQPRWADVALEEPYTARASSAYVHDGRRWRLAFHQQTPL
jgi:hypothetical protein